MTIPLWLRYRVGHGFRSATIAMAMAGGLIGARWPTSGEWFAILCGAVGAFWTGYDSYKQEPK